MSEEERNRAVNALKLRIPNLRCPMCNGRNFTVVDGYLVDPITNNYRRLELGGTTMPSAAIVCNNCGFVSRHALGAIGLMDWKYGEEKNNK